MSSRPQSLSTAGATPREILSLAVPAFLALVAEPLFLLADSAIVGRLGTPQLAGLGVAGQVLITAANVFIFLAYGTTSVVARALGAGRRERAIGAGIDGMWLAVVLGCATTALVVGFSRTLCLAFGPTPAALAQAVSYLRIAALGVPATLVVMAVTGVLRGLQDTRTPLLVSVTGFIGNIALNAALVFGAHLGIAGSALGTTIAQWCMAVAMLIMLLRSAIRSHVPMRPHPARILRAARGGVPLLIRTLALRAVLLLTTWAAAGFGDVALAGHQLASTIWSALAFALDALAIAAQALTGKSLGAGDLEGTKATTVHLMRWAVSAGAGLGALILVGHSVIPHLFTSDARVQQALASALLVIALSQPISGYAFLADGVLIGAGDGAWLARAALWTLALYLPVLLVARRVGENLAPHGGPSAALASVWIAFAVFMLIRSLFMARRLRTDRWMVTGA